MTALCASSSAFYTIGKTTARNRYISYWFDIELKQRSADRLVGLCANSVQIRQVLAVCELQNAALCLSPFSISGWVICPTLGQISLGRSENPPYERGEEGEATASQSLQGVVSKVYGRDPQPPGAFAAPPIVECCHIHSWCAARGMKNSSQIEI